MRFPSSASLRSEKIASPPSPQTPLPFFNLIFTIVYATSIASQALPFIRQPVKRVKACWIPDKS